MGSSNGNTVGMMEGLVGKSREAYIVVSGNDTAKSVGSGGLEVLATPRMIALVEAAAFELVEGKLGSGISTVGTLVNISHLSPTPLGMKVTAKATLREVEGKRLVFDVEASDEKGKIAEGTHERFIIDVERFMSKAAK
jgi:fluoroacetyl-CoA thioesterase